MRILSLFWQILFFMIGLNLAYSEQPNLWQNFSTLGAHPKYIKNFNHYSYVNPNAVKGGQLNMIGIGTFDNLNAYITEGTAESNISFIYDTLMTSSPEEHNVNYPLIAKSIQIAPDFSWARFRLNENAKFNDGTPLTARDVIWSFQILKTISPTYSSYYRDIKSAEFINQHEVKFTFATTGNRELAHILGALPILPQHWWLGKDKNGQQRDISKPLREIPLGSGPYRILSYIPGKSIIYQRVNNYWAQNLPVNIGRYNFDKIKITYFLDQNAGWEAFKKGGIGDFRQETRIQLWMQNYNFPAVKQNAVKLESFDIQSVGRMQAYFINTRRAKFADIRVRRALNLAFDFALINRMLFFNQYHRIESYFDGLDFVSAQSIPQGKELKLLKTVANIVPSEIFNKPFSLPLYSDRLALRAHLSEAMSLLKQAGWQLKNNNLVDKDGNPLTLEILLNNSAFERVTALYINNLRRLGIRATMRLIDPSQYQNRRSNFDYDLISEIIGQSDSPGNEQLNYFGSKSANLKDSLNYSGVQNKAVDIMINHIIYAKNREDLVAAARAMDRILLWNFYVVPQWYSPKINIAYWDKFDIPRPQPKAQGIDIFSWSINPKKEARLKNKN